MTSPFKIKTSSDLHLGHETPILKGHRPPNFEDQIIENHLKDIKEGETWLCLGDVFFSSSGKKKAAELIHELKKKGVPSICVIGNHDPQTVTAMMAVGFAIAMDKISLRLHGRNVILTHEPLDYQIGNSLNIHGHLHTLDGHRGGLNPDGKHILISMELLQYRPIDLATVVQLGKTPKYEKGRFVRAV